MGYQDKQEKRVTCKDYTALGEQRWPQLNTFRLSDDAVDTRRRYVGGSDANIIMSGNEDRLTALWLDKRGGEQPSLERVLQVMMGHWTEAFNRQWFEQETSLLVSDAGLVAVSAQHPWRRATLDGFVDEKRAVWEAKHVSAFAKSEEILARYMPQLQHNMAVLEVESSILSVIYGNHKWEMIEVAADWLYQDELLEAEQCFWASVQSGEPPVPAPPLPPPKPVGTRELCFEGNNRWAAAAADWIAHGESARLHAAASKDLKSLIEDDVTRAYGHGIEAKRSKAGALTIKGLAA